MVFLNVALRYSLATNTYRRFSTTATPRATLNVEGSGKKTGGAVAVPKSSCPPETVLEGLNYLKGQPPVLALADDQYPEWLWNVLRAKELPDDGPGGKAERMARRKERQQAIKDRNFMSTQ